MKKFGVALGYLSIIIISVFTFGVYVLGGIRYLGDNEENYCDMTWMFEYPQYVQIKLDDHVEKNYPRYGLFAYGEGFVTEKLRRMEFNGIPVLFIPGNAGSHQQVRSLASVCLRMSLKYRTPFHFDFFTVSLAEEYSALYGGVLKDQTVFVSKCIKKILRLYNGKENKVILIGHSMGGIIAKAALLYDNKLNDSLSNILITLAAPHISRFSIDKTLNKFYTDVNDNNTRLKDMGISVVSIGGGPRDHLVTSTQILDVNADVNILTTSIPDVWISTDHLSILWCKQLVISISRTLFDLIDVKHKKIYHQHDQKLASFNYHLINKFSGNNLEKYEMKVEFDDDDDDNGHWIEDSRSFFTWKLSDDNEKKYKKWIYLMLPIDTSKYDHLSIDAINLDIKNWLFVCKKKSSKCDWAWNITNRTTILPDYQNKIRKTFDINLHDIDKLKVTHFLLKIPNTKYPIIHIDMYDKKKVENNFISNYQFPLLSTFKKQIIHNSNGRIRHFINIKGIYDVVNIKIYKLTNEISNEKYGQIVVQLLEPDNQGHISQLRLITEKDIGKLIKLIIQTKSTSVLKITSDPSFKFEIHLTNGDMIDKISCYIRDNWFKIYPVIISTLLLLITTRINDNINNTIPLLITIIEIIYFNLYIEFIVSIGMINIFILLICLTFVFSGSIVHSITAKFIGRSIRIFPSSWYDWLLRDGTYERLPLLSTFILLSLIASSCGGLAMVISVPIYLLKLIHMYDDYVEELLISSFRMMTTKFDGLLRKWKKIKNQDDDDDGDDKRTSILNHIIIFLTWTIVAVVAIPSVLVWAKNFSYETRLSTEDTTMLTSWIIITVLGTMGLVKITNVNSSNNYLKLITIIQRLLGWFLLGTAGTKNPAVYQWMIPQIFAIFLILIVTTSQFFKLSTQKLEHKKSQ
ncbi:hypothetical protein HCN44_006577 [Aphidius gifuensis]|uniref:GPI inositol-deacylase n=1 Tax=Aphidius gifuensis TaxID=684658 RepID=A0A834Y0H3_APHGI|nr:GPI inositol-deacylase [Aphidius gifuensis]KAF7995470.1 hypothetical protein HCN44_006577 [Aphidius gifuensis]